ncbi:cornulin-like [Trachemys scripta elegans]|uniref:cornulin-like n=1 Tax=Trachemys scripta elegans TaxID=31138 RepID=UPI001554159D|nr:cornulin-like [Trachemys scripta elegans]
MPQLLDSISTLISVFYKPGKKDEDCSTISKREVKRFIQRGFADITVNPYDAHAIEAVLQLLDHDGDGVEDFNEFLLLVFRVAKVCYWYLQPKQHLPQRTETGLKRLNEAAVSHMGLNHDGMRGVGTEHKDLNIERMREATIGHVNLNHEGMRGAATRDVTLKQGR